MGIEFVVPLMALMQGMSEGLTCDGVRSLCQTEEHTLCKYRILSEAEDCEGQENGTSFDVRETIMGYHNFVRNKFAAGNISKWPAAANMRQITWDDDLAEVALYWAYQCRSGNDECRLTHRFKTGVGQNSGLRTANEQPPIGHGIDVFNRWLDEFDLASPTIVSKYAFDSKYGQFTSMIWAETYKIGCALVDSQSGVLFKSLFVCNYGPEGNIEGAPMYLTGDGCSKCEEGTACNPQSTFPKLCALPSDPADQISVEVYIGDTGEKFRSHIWPTFVATICVSYAT